MKQWKVSVGEGDGFHGQEWTGYTVYADTADDARIMAYLWHDGKVGGHVGQQMSKQYFALVCGYTTTPEEIIPIEERLKRAQKMLDPYRAGVKGAKLFGLDLNLFDKEDIMAALKMERDTAPF
jgi:hypothetical protein